MALLTTLTLPVRLPAVSGANATFIVADWLGIKMMPGVMPLVLNPVPVTVTPEIVTAELPVLVSVTVCDALVAPVVVVGKASELGEAESVRMGDVPAPESGMVSEEVGALLESVRVAEKVVADVGVKATVNSEEAP